MIMIFVMNINMNGTYLATPSIKTNSRMHVCMFSYFAWDREILFG